MRYALLWLSLILAGSALLAETAGTASAAPGKRRVSPHTPPGATRARAHRRRRSHTPARQRPRGGLASVIRGADGAEMVLVPAGEFTIGGNDGHGKERPVHKVRLDAFYIDRYEVTNAQYARFLSAARPTPEALAKLVDVKGAAVRPARGQWQALPGYERRPMVNVSWYGALAYATWAGKRLPSEAEWEKAARGTTARVYPWGNTWHAGACNDTNDGPGKTTPVGSYPRDTSPYGCRDMAGNVMEWTGTAEDLYPYRADDGREATGPTETDPDNSRSRGIRGGCSYDCPNGDYRTYHRGWGVPSGGSGRIGFRCARSLPPSSRRPREGPSR